MRGLFVSVVMGAVVTCLTGVTTFPAYSVLKSDPVASPRSGSITVVLKAPRGVPAQALIKGRKRAVVIKAAKVTSVTRKITLSSGTYAISAPRVLTGGVSYRPVVKQRRVKVRANRNARILVRWVKVEPLAAITVTGVTQRTVSLVWTGSQGASYVVRRTSGDTAASRRTAGVRVLVGKARQVTDTTAKPGQRYTYALFVKAKGRKARWKGPFSSTAGTPDVTKNLAAYDLREGSVIVDAGDKGDTVVRKTDGIWFTPASSRPALTLGAGVVLPISKELPAGMLAVVDRVGNGRQVRLRAGGLLEVFADYDAHLSLDRTTIKPRMRVSPTGVRRSASAQAGCDLIVGTGAQVGLDPALGLRGDVDVSSEKSGPLGVTSSMVVDAEVDAVVSIKADVAFSQSFSCNLLPIGQGIYPVPAGPVPFAVMWNPAVQVSAQGALTLEDAEWTTETGFDGSVKLPYLTAVLPLAGVAFEASGSGYGDIKSKSPRVAGTGTMALEATGYVTFGFGTGVKDAGVIAGGGLDAGVRGAIKVRAEEDGENRFCLTGEREMWLQPELRLEAFVSNWNATLPIRHDGWSASKKGTDGPFPADCVPLDTSDPLWGWPPYVQGSDDTLLAERGIDFRHDFTVQDDRDGRFSVTGELPAGLDFKDGVLSGTPTELGTWHVDVAFIDRLGQRGERRFAVEVIQPGPPQIATTELPDGQVNLSYDATVRTVRGRAGSWDVASGSLPPGLRLVSEEDGPGAVIDGFPEEEGVHSFTLRFTDPYDRVATRDYVVRTAADPAVALEAGGRATSAFGARDAALSQDGRWVAYTARRTAGEGCECTDVWVWDSVTKEHTRVSAAMDGGWADGSSERASVSNDGRYVAFFSNASNIAGGVDLAPWDVYLWSRATGDVRRLTQGGTLREDEMNDSDTTRISADGRYVTFGGRWDGLGDARPGSGRASEVYQYDASGGVPQALSLVNPELSQGHNWLVDASDDGAMVTFASSCPDCRVVPLLHDRVRGQTVVARGLPVPAGGSSRLGIGPVSGNGSVVAQSQMWTFSHGGLQMYPEYFRQWWNPFTDELESIEVEDDTRWVGDLDGDGGRALEWVRWGDYPNGGERAELLDRKSGSVRRIGPARTGTGQLAADGRRVVLVHVTHEEDYRSVGDIVLWDLGS